MPLPGDVNVVQVTGFFTDSAGNPVGGTVAFTPTAPLTNPAGMLVIPAVTRSYTLQGGRFTSDPLVATDSVVLSPAGWAYDVKVSIENIQPYSFTTFLPSDPSTVDMSALEPVFPAGTVLTPGNYLPADGGTETGTLVLDGTPPLNVPGATLGQILISDASGNFTAQANPGGGGGGNVIDGVTVSGTTVSGRTIIATGTTTATWQLPLQVDSTSSDIQPLASSGAWGSLQQAAAADHVHPTTGLVTTSGLPLPVSEGGTGSGTQNFADLTTNQTIAGIKTFTGEVIVPAPVNATDAVTKSYADAIALGLPGKFSAHAATVGSEGYTYTIVSGSVTQISGTVIDAVSPSIGDFLLVKDAPSATGTGSAFSSEPANGHYQVTGTTTNLSVMRAADMSGANGPAGAYVFVEAGTANAGDGFVVTTPSTSGAFTYGSGTIQFTQFTSSGTISAGAGLTQSGSVISLTSPVAAASLPAATTSVQGAVILDNLSTDIKQLAASRSAGTSTQAAKADHVHPTTGLITSGASAGGDISGTYPTSLTVAKIQGTTIVSPPGGTTAFLAGNGTWQTPSGTGSIAAGYTLVVAASGASTKVKAGADYLCTGTNDHTTINTAIAALPGGGGTILLSAGVFNLGGPVAIAASNISLEGTGVSTELAVTSGSNLTAAITVLGSGVVECKIRRLWINGSITDTSGSGIRISTPWSTTDTQHVVEDVYITGCPNNGFEVPVWSNPPTNSIHSDTRVMLISRVHVKGCNGNGFYLAYPSTTDSVFTDCIADTNALNGFYLGGANCWLTNCKAFYNGSSGSGNYGFYLVGYNNYLTGCQSQDNYYHGFYGDQTGDATYGSFGCTFDNCTADNNGQHTASLASGWYLNGVQQWQIIGGISMCRPYATGPWQDYGITLAGTAAYNTIKDVLFYDNQSAAIQDLSTGPTYTSGNNYSTGAPASAWGLLPSSLGGSDAANVLAYGAKGDGQHVATGAMSSSSTPTVLTVGSSVFTANDVGKQIIVYGAGTSGAHLGTTISAYTSGTSVTLATSCLTTVSSAIVVWGTNNGTAIQAAFTAAGAGASPVYFPTGIYMTTTGVGNNVNGNRVYGDGAGSVADNQQAFTSSAGTNYGSTIVCMPSMSASSFMGSTTTASFREFDHLGIVWTAAGGKIFGSEGVTNAPAYVHDCRFEVNDPGGNGQVTASFVESPFMEWARCGMIQTSSTRQLPLYQFQGTSSGGEANVTFRQCQWYQTGTDHSQPYVDIEFQGPTSFAFTATHASPCVFTATGSAYGNTTAVTLAGGSLPGGFTSGTTYYVVAASGATFELSATSGGSPINSTTTGSGSVSNADGYAMQVAFRDCTFGRAWGGAVKMLGCQVPVFDNCGFWDLNDSGGPAVTAVSSLGILYFGEFSGSSPCRNIRVTGCFKNRTWADGSHAWDIYCESTTRGVFIENFATKPDNSVSGANLYINLNGCADVYLRGNQTPSGNNPGTTVISSPSATQITQSAGAIQLTAGAANGYVLTSDANGNGSWQAASGGGGSSSVQTVSYGTASETLNAATFGAFLITLTGNPTFSFSGAVSGTECSFTLYLKQDGTGSRTVTWPTVKWQDAIAPTLTTTASATDILVFSSPDGGTTWYGALAGANY